MEHTAKHSSEKWLIVSRNETSCATHYLGVWKKKLENHCLLKQKTQGSVPLNTLTVPELIQTLPSLQPQGSSRCSMSEAVLGISDILVQFWMRILGSVPLTNGSWLRIRDDKDDIQILQIQMQIRNTGKKVIKKSQKRRNQGFSTIFAWRWKDLERIRICTCD